MDCVAIFKKRPKKDCVDYCVMHDPDGSCQEHAVSKNSPGPVSNTEILARHVISPTHVNKDPPHELTEAFFQDAFSIGLSTIRLLHGWETQRDSVHNVGEKRAADQRKGLNDYFADSSRKYLGVVHFLAKSLRAEDHTEFGVRGKLRIYDTADDDDTDTQKDAHVKEASKLHADIMVAIRGLPNADEKTRSPKQMRKLIRARLYVLARDSGIYPSPILPVGDHSLVSLGIRIVSA